MRLYLVRVLLLPLPPLRERDAGTMADATQRWIELADADFNLAHVRQLGRNAVEHAVGDVFEQAGGGAHLFGHEAVEDLIIHRLLQLVRLAGGQQVGFDVKVDAVFVADFLLLIIITMEGKKLQPFECDLAHEVIVCSELVSDVSQ